MTQRPWSLLLLCVTLSAVAQLALKYGMARTTVATGGFSLTLRGLFEILFNPAVFAGLSLYTISVVLWLLVLARVDVSQAYPFVGAGFIITMIGGALIFNEPVNLPRVAGALLICAGLILVGRS